MAQALQSRMSKEVRQLAAEPPPGVWCAPRGDSLTQLDAQLEVSARNYFVYCSWSLARCSCKVLLARPVDTAGWLSLLRSTRITARSTPLVPQTIQRRARQGWLSS